MNLDLSKVSDVADNLTSFLITIDGKKQPINYFSSNKDLHSDPEVNNYQIQFNRLFNIYSPLIRKNSTVIDIGCAQGDTSIAMAVLAENGSVLCFDPNLETFQLLALNAGLNPHLNIYGYNVAVMEHDGEYEFRYNETMRNGGPSLFTSRVGDYSKVCTMRGVNLIEFARDKHDLKDVSFIKIDTEGYDCHIIATLVEIIEKNRPYILIEWFPYTEPNIERVLDELNYIAVDPETHNEIAIVAENYIHDILLIPK